MSSLQEPEIVSPDGGGDDSAGEVRSDAGDHLGVFDGDREILLLDGLPVDAAKLVDPVDKVLDGVSGGHQGKNLPHILFGECVSAARSQSFYPTCNAHGFIYLFYSLAKLDKCCIISQVNGLYQLRKVETEITFDTIIIS